MVVFVSGIRVGCGASVLPTTAARQGTRDPGSELELAQGEIDGSIRRDSAETHVGRGNQFPFHQTNVPFHIPGEHLHAPAMSY